MRYWLDTEFNGYLGELISLALVAEDGRELYLLNIDRLENTIDWVRENVVPILGVPGADPVCSTLDQISFEIEKFMTGDSRPVIVSDWPDDIKYFCEAAITGPGRMIEVPQLEFQMLRVDAYPTDLPGAVQHNALWDARALKAKTPCNSCGGSGYINKDEEIVCPDCWRPRYQSSVLHEDGA